MAVRYLSEILVADLTLMAPSPLLVILNTAQRWSGIHFDSGGSSNTTAVFHLPENGSPVPPSAAPG